MHWQFSVHGAGLTVLPCICWISLFCVPFSEGVVACVAKYLYFIEEHRLKFCMSPNTDVY